MNSLKHFTLCLSLLFLSSCITYSSGEIVRPKKDRSKAERPKAEVQKDEVQKAEVQKAEVQKAEVPPAKSLVAQDFVNVMMQVDGLVPTKSTVLEFSSSDLKQKNLENRDFGNALHGAAAEAGYTVKAVDEVDGSNPVKFSVTELKNTADGVVSTYDVSVGDVDFRREYLPVSNGRVTPRKAMLIRGADIANIESDDSIFEQKPVQKAEAVVPPVAKAPVEKPAMQPIDGFDSPVARKDEKSRLEAELEEQGLEVSKPAIVAAPTTSAPATNAPKNNAQKTVGNKINIAESGTSNYDSLLGGKQNVAEEILVFGDDSYVLGSRNKKILSDIMESYNPETDVISVVGCSTGTTKISNGNAALAIGRANRVKEALLYSGIEHDKIYDEGCWSPDANSTPFPNRGVVITVKRGVDNG